jgi:hypothetical protein
MKKYLIRVAKYIVYLYVLFMLVYGLMCFFGTVPPGIGHFFNQRLLIAIVLLGFVYPLIGFKRITVDMPPGGRDQHTTKICEAIELCGFRIEKQDGDSIIFVAVSPVRRIIAMYEDSITLTFLNTTTITVSGLRKDVAKVQLRLNDYIRYYANLS